MSGNTTPEGEQERIKRLVRRFAGLESERKSWEGHWRELATMFLPRRSRFLDAGERTNDGSKRSAINLVDSTGLSAVRTLASGMQSGLTSPARPWFRLTLKDADVAGTDEAKAWLHQIQGGMEAAFARSNFYDSIHLLYHELAVFGTACMIVEEDAETCLRCRTFTVGEYVIDTGASGRVNALFRKIHMTPRQLLEAWPKTCPARVKEMVEREQADRLEVLHAIEVNPDHQPKRQNGKERPFHSVYLLWPAQGQGQREILEDSGYYEFPALAPRWDVTGDDVYGRSPAMDVLGDSKMLQKMRAKGLEMLEKEVNPPLLVPATLTGEAIKGDPGAINYFSPLAQGQQSIVPLYQVKSNLAANESTISVFQRQIREGLFNDLFLMISQMNRQMTATEVAERNAEKMLLLGPVLDRLRSELFQPLIARVFGIMQRQGMVAPAPDSLQGREIGIEFVSILAQAQKAAGIAAVNQVVGFVGGIAQMNPGVLDKMNFDEAVDTVADMLGVPPKLIRSAEMIAQLRAQREQQQQQQQQMQMMQQGIDMAGGAAKAARDAGDAGILP